MSKDFKILYHSAPPMADTGYGTHTRNLSTRLNEDFEVAIHSVGGWEGMGIDYDGIQIYPSGAGEHGEQSIPYWFEETDADVVFSHHDHWSMADTLRGQQHSGIPMVLYTILDHDLPGREPPKAVVQANEFAHKTVVMSEWAEDRLKRSRIPEDDIVRIPHGVDTSKFAPVTDDISQAELKRDLGIPEDSFLFGMVAANYGPRKNIPVHMQAFKEFKEEYDVDDAYFYIHTHARMSGGYNLYEVRDALNIDPDECFWPDGHKIYHGIDDLYIVQLYNTFDVSLNATQSESWGLTITEAMSCGTPVIGCNNSAQTEQFDVPFDTFVDSDEGYRVTPNGLLVHRGNALWTQNAVARRWIPDVEDIKEAMAYYYFNQDEMERQGQNARDFVVENFNYDYLYDEHWQPFFEEVEEDLKGDYNHYYFKKRDAETQSEAFKAEFRQIDRGILGDSVLDVGAGSGTLSALLQERGYDVVAVEYSDEGVRYIEEEKEEDIEVYQGDIRDLQFKDDSFDTAVSQHVLEHVEADAASLAELCRVAREKVVCIVPTRNPMDTLPDSTEVRRYDEQELERLKSDFETISDCEMEYRSFRTNEDNKNWVIEVEV